MLSPDSLDWAALGDRLDAHGFAVTDPLLDAGECADLAALFDDGRFRSTVDMARHRFGEGQYRYFAHPLPEVVTGLRAAFWPHLLPIARDWAERLCSGGPTCGPTTSRTGWRSATGRARPTRPRCCSVTSQEGGTRCTATSTATSSSRSRS
jgi:hypothetical protein